MKTYQAQIQGRGKEVGIVVAKFNEFITKRLYAACVDELVKNGVRKEDITVVWVPGSFEIPLVALKLAKKKNIDGVICLGAVIKGGTYHFELVAEGAMYGIAQVSLMTGKPVIFEVLACETMEQANARSKVKGHNKGRDAATVVLEMIDLLSQIKK